jgi:hypothetical protein
VVTDNYDNYKSDDSFEHRDLNNSPRKVASIKKQNKKAVAACFFDEEEQKDDEMTCFTFGSQSFKPEEMSRFSGCSSDNERSVSEDSDRDPKVL